MSPEQDNMMFGTICIVITIANRGWVLGSSSPIQANSCDSGVDLVEISHPSHAGCLAASEKYLTSYDSEKHNNLADLDFYGFTSEKYVSNTLCETLADKMINSIEVVSLKRHLLGEGSHQRILTSIKLNIQSDFMSWIDNHVCEAMVVEILPLGVFADPFELQHLVQHHVFRDAAVFGDTNLELPSALSNQSIVEIHMDIGCGAALRCCEIVIELPLHARYPPLDTSQYSRVEIGKPDLFMRCRPKQSQGTNYWTVINSNAGSSKSLMWLVPCGNKRHATIVSTTTFFSALVSALIIVLSAVYCGR